MSVLNPKRNTIKSKLHHLIAFEVFLRRCCKELTQQGRVSISQRKPLITGYTEGREKVKFPLQQRLQTGGRGISWVEQVVDLLACRPQLGH